MQYNFDEIVERRGTGCVKYDELEKKFGRSDIIPLWIADMDFRTAQPVIDALKKRAEDGIFGYVSRSKNYFKAGCDWQKRRNGWEIDTNLCSWSLGIVPAMVSMALLWAKENPNILIQTPVYSEFYEIVEKTGNTVIENRLIEKDGVWTMDWEDFEEKIKTVSMFLFCSPNNPLGIVWDAESIKRMVDLCHKHNVLMISDEIHSDFIFGDKKFIPTCTVSEMAKKNVIVCFSGTKTFNLAGLQACTVVFPNEQLKKEFDEFWMQKDIRRNNSFSNVAMEVCFNEGEEWLEQLLVYLKGNFEFVQEYLKTYIPKIKTHIPDATYVMWLDCRDLNMSNEELSRFMIDKARIGLNDGHAYARSLSGYMRLNAACPRSVLKKALEQLREAVDSL